jgi:hypothetical protein
MRLRFPSRRAIEPRDVDSCAGYAAPSDAAAAWSPVEPVSAAVAPIGSSSPPGYRAVPGRRRSARSVQTVERQISSFKRAALRPVKTRGR